VLVGLDPDPPWAWTDPAIPAKTARDFEFLDSHRSGKDALIEDRQIWGW